MMTNDQIKLIRDTFAQVAPIADTAAESFYTRLFELDPKLRFLFRGDMREQGRKLMQMLAVVVRSLDDLDRLLPAVQALGRRHATYGVTAEHHATVAAALLDALGAVLGSTFSADVRDAWTSAYNVLASTMTNAAADCELRAA
jgi:hemoglobin-like flavoprotein